MTCQQCEAKDRELSELRRECDRKQGVLDRIDDALRGCDLMPAPRGRQVKIITEAGRAIAAGATAKGMKLTEVSRAAGFAADYVAKICRGDLAFSRRAALLIGAVLGIDLTIYVEAPLREVAARAAEPEPLPFFPGPCAADLARSAS